MINQQILEGKWNEFKGRILQKWSQLTDSDLGQFRGNVDELIGTIQRKTGEGREAVEGFLHDLTAGAGTFAGQAAESVREGVRQAAECARGSARQAAEQFAELRECTQCLVRDRPGLALAISFGAGMLAGLILALKHRAK
jgi:uncharacterized protein YjbJ (UPF0337 family)